MEKKFLRQCPDIDSVTLCNIGRPTHSRRVLHVLTMKIQKSRCSLMLYC